MEFRNMEKYYQARERGANWLLSQIKADGSLEGATGLSAYYKIPYALVVAGHPLVARRVLDHLKRTFLTNEGDYLDLPGDESGLVHVKHFYIYRACWIAEAAQRMGSFDIAQRSGAFLLRFQDEKSGGFHSHIEGLKGGAQTDILSTARGGMLCLFLGKMNEAAAAGQFLLRAADGQPRPDDAIFVNFSPSGAPITTIPKGDKEILWQVKAGVPGQAYYYLGYPMAFLARLYQATGEERFLEGAKRYFQFHEKCAPDAFSSWPSGKSGWGVAILHTITGEEEYGRAAEMLADFLLHTQSPDGFWFNPRGFARVKDQPPALTYDATAEFVIWLSGILQEIP